VVDADGTFNSGLAGNHEKTLPIGYLHDVGKVEFALGVVVAHLIEQWKRMLARHCHDAAVAERDLLLLLGAILLLAYGEQTPILFYKPSITRRILRPETQDRYCRAL